ncbi:DUF2764 domain-containing protein [Sphingobacteriales bacterium UPWRP_1]|nr:hypothetical protein BVG80_01835 [Sphingobacteriales bacterium TSM_CSM]PSJ75101.1 DUF2764 domain-containing protein [Sphingobacteriales bacterium UPWRP_1]
MSSPTRNYYGLISSLPNLLAEGGIMPEDGNLATRFADFMHPADVALLQLAYMPADHANLLNILYNRQQPYHNLGNFTPQQLNTLIAQKWLPYPYLDSFFTQWWQHYGKTEPYAHAEIELTGRYHRFLLACENPFLQKWSRFMLELTNFSLLQYAAHGLPKLQNHLVAKEEVAYLAGKYSALSELEALIPVTQTAEIWNTENPMEREKLLDDLKWQFIETEQFFYFFGIEKVIGYALQQQIALRWYRLRNPGNALSTTALPNNPLAALVTQLISPIYQQPASTL